MARAARHTPACYLLPVRFALVLVSILGGTAACKSRSESPPPAPAQGGTTVTAPVASPIAIDPPSAPGALAPNLQTSPGGVLATWLEPLDEDRHRLQFSRWTSGSWTAPVTIVEDGRIVANWADVPSVAQSGDGALVAHWAQTSGSEAYAYDAMVARSTDGGTTWTPVGPLNDDGTPTEHGFVSLVGEERGVRAFWLDGRATGTEGGAMTLRTAMVGDAIASGEVVDAIVCDCCGTAAASSAGGPVVAYRDRSRDEIRDIATARRPEGAAWASSSVHRDGWQIAGCPVNGPAIAVRGRSAAVAWYTYAGSTHRVRLAFSEDAGATFAAPIDVDAARGSRAPVGRVSVVLDGDGAAIVGWLASDREDAAILLRRVGRDGALGAELRIGGTTAGRDAGFPKLAATGDGVVAIWTEPGEASRLRAVHVPLAAIPRLGSATEQPKEERADPLVAVGGAAPSIDAVGLDGAAASLAALRGKVVLLNLWATWCEPCRHELPVLGTLHERDGARGLAVVAINVDRNKSRDDIASFVARRKLPFTIWLDPEDRVSAALGASTYPVNLLIGRDGKVLWRRDGAIRGEDPELRAALDAALDTR